MRKPPVSAAFSCLANAVVAGETTAALLDMAGPLCYTTPVPQGNFDSFGRLAQLVEQLTLNQRVVGSSPTSPTNKLK